MSLGFTQQRLWSIHSSPATRQAVGPQVEVQPAVCARPRIIVPLNCKNYPWGKVRPLGAVWARAPRTPDVGAAGGERQSDEFVPLKDFSVSRAVSGTVSCAWRNKHGLERISEPRASSVRAQAMLSASHQGCPSGLHSRQHTHTFWQLLPSKQKGSPPTPPPLYVRPLPF